MAENACEFKPKLTVREKTVKRALSSYIVEPVCKKYLALSIRVLWRNDGTMHFNDLYEKRIKLQEELRSVKEVVFFIDCITAMTKRESVHIGFAFWIAYDFVQTQASKLETFLIKKILETNVDVEEVKSVNSRGNEFCQCILYNKTHYSNLKPF